MWRVSCDRHESTTSGAVMSLRCGVAALFPRPTLAPSRSLARCLTVCGMHALCCVAQAPTRPTPPPASAGRSRQSCEAGQRVASSEAAASGWSHGRPRAARSRHSNHNPTYSHLNDPSVALHMRGASHDHGHGDRSTSVRGMNNRTGAGNSPLWSPASRSPATVGVQFASTAPRTPGAGQQPQRFRGGGKLTRRDDHSPAYSHNDPRSHSP